MASQTRDRLKTILAIAGAAVLISSGIAGLFSDRAVPTARAQTDQFLLRRIDQVEYRFNSIEARLNRIETQSRPATASPRITPTGDVEIQFMRTQIESLRTRLGETECGILRLDERTLTPAARTARDKGTVNSEVCRRDPAGVINLSARP